MANSVWALSDELLVEHTRACNKSNTQHWIFYMMETLPHDQFMQMTVTLWAIWTSRRKKIQKEIFQSLISTNGFINSYLDELRGLSKLGTITQVQQPAAKINVDAVVSRLEKKGVPVTFCRDSHGTYHGARQLSSMASPIQQFLRHLHVVRL
jgi:hypothetical protein